MLLSMKLAKLFLLLMISIFQAGSAEAADHAKVIHRTGSLTEYSLEENGSPVLVSWTASGQEKAIVLAIHGFGLHKYAFSAFAARMQEVGISTFALDVRGFGEWAYSDESNQQLNLQKGLQDIKETLQELRAENPYTPIFLLGESMGGALALRAAADSPELVTGVISSVPSGQLVGKNRLALKLMVKYLLSGGRRVDVSKQVLGKATADAQLLSLWLSDSSIRLKVGRSELLQFSKFMSHNDQVAKSIKQTPVLMVQGDSDRLVQSRGSIRLFDEMPTADKSMLMVKGGEHLTFEEGQFNDRVLNSVSKWLSSHSTQTSIIASNG